MEQLTIRNKFRVTVVFQAGFAQYRSVKVYEVQYCISWHSDVVYIYIYFNYTTSSLVSGNSGCYKSDFINFYYDINCANKVFLCVTLSSFYSFCIGPCKSCSLACLLYYLVMFYEHIKWYDIIYDQNNILYTNYCLTKATNSPILSEFIITFA